MPNSHISTKILLVIAGISFVGLGILVGTFAYLLNRDYHEQYDTSLINYAQDAVLHLAADVQSHSVAVEKLANIIESDLAENGQGDGYWQLNDSVNFAEERRRLDLHSSVFVPKGVGFDKPLLDEVATTYDAWNDVDRSFDSRMMSISYISALGFVRTQPSHRAAFFPDDYDPRGSRLYQQHADDVAGLSLAVALDPLNDIYILTATRDVTVNEALRGVVAGVFELPFKLNHKSDKGDRFQPQLLIVDEYHRLLANPLGNTLLQHKVEQASASDTLPAAGTIGLWSINGTLYRITVRSLKETGWKVLALYPQAFLSERIINMEATLVKVLLVGGIALIVLAYLALRSYVIGPLQRLTTATGEIATNQWRFDPPAVADDEIGQLSTVIDTLATELRSTLDSHTKTIVSLDNMSHSLSSVYSTLDASDNMTAILEVDWRIIYANEKFSEAFTAGEVDADFRSSYQTLLSDTPDDYFSLVENSLKETGVWTNEIRVMDGEGIPRSYLEKVLYHRGTDGEVLSVIYNAQALFQSSKDTEEMERLAYYDHLTGLQNRTFFKGVMEEELSSLQRSDHMLALLYIDLDNFKMINDSLGHESGDELLVEASSRLKQCLRTEDAVARIGGDEFAVLLKDVDALHYVSIVANKILQALNLPMHLAGQTMSVKASIGVTIAPDDGEDVMELMKNADLAMYQAKDKGKNNFRFYTQDMNRQVSRRMEIEREIRRGLDNHEFVLFYQPKVHLETGKVDAAEALVRWKLPDGSIRGPQEFIPAAEDSGLIIDLGLWILKTACQQAKTLYKSVRRDVVISVNVSARQLTAPDFVSTVEKTLQEVGLKPSLLELEITESLFMTNLDQTIDNLDAIRRLGVRISIDDFGTGYSSLSYLKRLPIDQLKVDRSFIMDLPEDEDDRVITELIISMAKQLKLEVVAEGVETEEQHRYLDSLDCDYVQGYLFAKPLPPDEFMVYVFDAAQKERGVFG